MIRVKLEVRTSKLEAGIDAGSQSMLRNLMLRAADNPSMVKLFAGLGKRSGLSNRFVAGENLETAMAVVREINEQKIKATLDLLGEGVSAPDAAERAADAYIGLLERIAHEKVNSGISIKLTQLGLDVDRRLCERNLAKILDKASRLNNFVRIDMESSEHTQATLEVFEESFERYGKKRVGIVIQSYLRRSEEDVRRLAGKGCSVRLCKGAYKEPPEIAFPDKADVDRNFIKLMEILLGSESHTAIASHDQNMIEPGRAFIAAHRIPSERYEFQMLYGVRRDYQLRLRDQGCPVRIYVPFGTEWAPYFMRRLAERPANLLFVTRAVFGK